MLRSLARNFRMQAAILGLVTAFFLMWGATEPALLMVVLNGLFAGAIVTIGTSYYHLIVSAIRGDGEYDRVRLMTLGIFMLWLSVVMTVSVSIYARSTELYTATYMAAAGARYTAIIAAIMQMRSLDYGYALWQGRDRVLIWAGTIAGAIVAAGAIILQLQVGA